MKSDNRFTHRCRCCGYRWFTSHEFGHRLKSGWVGAQCRKCRSSKRDTYKLVPVVRERKVRLELAAYLGLVALGAVIPLLLRL